MTRHAVHIATDAEDARGGAGSGLLLNYARDSYLERTSRPIYAVAFLLPFVVLYEIGTLAINTNALNHSQVRVVAFVWLQELLRHLGYDGRLAWIAPPLVVIVILLGLQIASHKPWYVLPADVAPMIAECLLLSVPLIVLSLFLNTRASGPVPAPTAQVQGAALSVLAATAGGGGLRAEIVTGIGAGIYEELVFRLILISVLVFLLQDLLRLKPRTAVVTAVLVSAALFSAHHHVIFVHGHLGQTIPFSWAAFGFRTLAGVYFAGLFALRGFGITAGTHALYDVLATCLNAFFFA